MGSRCVRVLRYLKLGGKIGLDSASSMVSQGPHSELGNKAPLGPNWVWMSEKQEQPSALKAGSLHPGPVAVHCIYAGGREPQTLKPHSFHPQFCLITN